jgi:cation transport protein ChaC
VQQVRHIFAYGSLMWRPDFEFVSARKAEVQGYHRRLCVLSHHYRGTVEKQGLVLGLDVGGVCQGIIYEIALQNWDTVLSRVRARELLGDAYDELVLPFKISAGDGVVSAITYVVRKQSTQFAPVMGLNETLTFINQGQGVMGSCRDYVANTIRHLRQLEIFDPELEALADHVL